jgi:hypothetical protein
MSFLKFSMGAHLWRARLYRGKRVKGDKSFIAGGMLWRVRRVAGIRCGGKRAAAAGIVGRRIWTWIWVWIGDGTGVVRIGQEMVTVGLVIRIDGRD